MQQVSIRHAKSEERTKYQGLAVHPGNQLWEIPALQTLA